MKPSKAFIFVANIIKDRKLGNKIKADFDQLPKKEQTAHKLLSITAAHFAFFMESTYGYPHELTYEMLEERLNESITK